VHGDLLPGNLLVVDGRMSAVIDFGDHATCRGLPAYLWHDVTNGVVHNVPWT